MLLAVLAAWLPAAAAPEAASENAVRAVLFYNFLKFADLPSTGSEQGTLTLCIASNDPDLLAMMEQLQGRRVHGRPISVQRGKQQACDAIYVDARARWQFLEDLPGTPRALSVGAYPGFIDDGGMVEVDFQRNQPRFDINVAQARRAGIHFSPQLLQLARRVYE